MPRVHLFNPENDLALAAGIANYTPPAAALRLRRAGERLPLLYAEDGDRLLVDGVEDWTGMEPCPWGWSAAAKRDFLLAGCPVELLPSDDEIEQMRMLSHRRTAAEIARRLREMLPGMALADPAVEAYIMEDVDAEIGRHGDVFVKMPWSSSGRGVLRYADVSPERFRRFAADSIRRQGSVMVERAYCKVVDFARLYRCEDGKCISLGTSVFVTDAHGAYTGNLLAPEQDRLQRIAGYASLQDIADIDAASVEILQEMISPYYNGILGIDMLVAADGTIDATVELNLRHTMGYVALKLSEKVATPSLFTVTPLPAPPYFTFGVNSESRERVKICK